MCLCACVGLCLCLSTHLSGAVFVCLSVCVCLYGCLCHSWCLVSFVVSSIIQDVAEAAASICGVHRVQFTAPSVCMSVSLYACLLLCLSVHVCLSV